MKKILISITIFLFTVSGYAGIYRSESTNSEQYSSGGVYVNSYSTGVEETSGSGIYKTSADNPDDRPGSGGAIGQEAPLGDGLRVLTVCCVIYGVVKIVNKKRNDKL
jgi:hypothetical protein